MSAEVYSENPGPVEVLDLLIARHGLFRVIMALPAVLLKRRNGTIWLVPPIPEHLARDIGLHQEPVRRTHWDYR